jgi:hypothetical protein
MKSFGFGWKILLAILFVTTGCASASKSFKKGQYDDAVAQCIKILHKEPSNQKHLEILRDAYRMADFNDQERVLALKQTGQPDIWSRVVTTYEHMAARNRKMEALPSSVKNTIHFIYISYIEELGTAKQKATEYYYAAGIEKLNIGSRTEARRAFSDFEKVVLYSGHTYRDVRNLKAHAEELGTTHVLFRLANSTGSFLSQEVMFNLTNIHPQAMNRRWVKYDTEPHFQSYQFEVTFTLERTLLYPVTVSTKRFSETRTITEGTEYKTDSKGKPVLDSSGNFIRIPKQVILKCTVTEIIQQKRIRLDGTLTYYDAEIQRFVRTIPLNRTAVAQSSTFRTVGDLRALSDQNRKRVSAPFIPLPNDDVMLVMVSKELNADICNALSENSGLIR